MEALRFPVGDDSVSALLIWPVNAKALYVFAHGAGAGMSHKAMEFERVGARGSRDRDVAVSISIHGEGLQAGR